MAKKKPERRFVGIRELANKASEIVRDAEDGKHVFITRRGAVVAVIIPADVILDGIVFPGIRHVLEN